MGDITYSDFVLVYAMMLLANCLWCVGVHTLTRFLTFSLQDGAIPLKSADQPAPLWFVGYYSDKYAKQFGKALCNCLVCMSSIHGALFFWGLHPMNWINVAAFVLYVIILAGMNRIANEIIS